MKPVIAIALAMTLIACRPARVVKIGWDVPTSRPDGYWVLVDDRKVLDVHPPPPPDPKCSCLSVEVRVGPGRHTLRVVAYTRDGGTSPSTTLTVQ